MKQKNYYLPQLCEIETFFNVPLEMAAAKMNISKTKLKNLCREYGLLTWPYKRNKIQKEVKSHGRRAYYSNQETPTRTSLRNFFRNNHKQLIQQHNLEYTQQPVIHNNCYSQFSIRHDMSCYSPILPSLSDYFGDHFLKSTDPKFCESRSCTINYY
ncbi:RKD4 [Acrasis kona]|uniref:RKD4 n=1 Tax=Acrasis kona TaxID=1008807 RepID=A0AAW2ZRD2_9EUKA